MLPKFHCKLNPIDRVYGHNRSVLYSIVSLRKMIIPALETVTLENIQNYFRKVRHYIMYAYLEGLPGGSALEKLVKKYKTVIESHRRISEHE